MNCLAITSIFGTILVYGLNQIYERVMQDFTKPLVATNAAPTAKSIWLTKDRLWNFVFWFGMSFGFSSALILANIGSKQNTFSYWISFLFWATIFGVPFLVRRFSKTTFVKDKIFLNSEGNVIPEKNMPDLGVIFLLTVLALAITGFIFDKFKILDHLGTVAIAMVLFGIPSLFFIYKNCPISILFNRKYRELYLSNNDGYKTRTRNSSRFVTHPVYKFLPYNIFHKRR